MALERVPADIRREGGVARMTDPKVNNKLSVKKLILSDVCHTNC
jgi:pyridoxal biosynthesis lyase PdxS